MRRFPPPWTIEENNNACFIVKDATGQALAYVYFERSPLSRQLRRARGAAAPRVPSGREGPNKCPIPATCPKCFVKLVVMAYPQGR